MPCPETTKHPHGKRRYQSVAEGMAMAQAFVRSGLGMADFARQQGVSFRMVKYWSARIRHLAVASEAAVAHQVLEHVADIHPDGEIALSPITKSAPALVHEPDRGSAVATIEVHLPGGVHLAVRPGFSPSLLKQVILAIEGHRSC